MGINSNSVNALNYPWRGICSSQQILKIYFLYNNYCNFWKRKECWEWFLLRRMLLTLWPIVYITVSESIPLVQPLHFIALSVFSFRNNVFSRTAAVETRLSCSRFAADMQIDDQRHDRVSDAGRTRLCRLLKDTKFWLVSCFLADSNQSEKWDHRMKMSSYLINWGKGSPVRHKSAPPDLIGL